MANRYQSNWEEQNLRKNTVIVIAVCALALVLIVVFFASISVFITHHDGMKNSCPRTVEQPELTAADAPQAGSRSGNRCEPQTDRQGRFQDADRQEPVYRNQFYIHPECKLHVPSLDWTDILPLFPDPSNIRYAFCPDRPMD